MAESRRKEWAGLGLTDVQSSEIGVLLGSCCTICLGEQLTAVINPPAHFRLAFIHIQDLFLPSRPVDSKTAQDASNLTFVLD